jgi:hypothetical protein
MLLFFKWFPRLMLIGSLVTFSACLMQDAFYIAGPSPKAWSDSWALLLTGWSGIIFGTVAWLANPALASAWILSIARLPGLSLLSAVIALAFMLSFLLETNVVTSTLPTYSDITGYGTGFWLWVCSATLQGFGSAVAAMPTDFLSSKDNPA